MRREAETRPGRPSSAGWMQPTRYARKGETVPEPTLKKKKKLKFIFTSFFTIRHLNHPSAYYIPSSALILLSKSSSSYETLTSTSVRKKEKRNSSSGAVLERSCRVRLFLGALGKYQPVVSPSSARSSPSSSLAKACESKGKKHNELQKSTERRATKKHY
jgi:hypothetical protein